MTKAVIFDMDGLLVDTEWVGHRVYEEILKDYGIPFTKQEYARDYCGKTIASNVVTFINAYNLPWSFEQGMEIVVEMEARLLDLGAELKTGAQELLAYLKENGYRIALGTSSEEMRARKLLRQHDIEGFFDAFVFEQDVTRGKPYPDIFLKACEKLGEAPENCLVLEDSEAGLRSAQAARIPVICIPDMKMPQKPYLDRAAAVLPSLNDVIGYLQVNS